MAMAFNCVNQWFKINLLSINANKTHYIQFKTKNKPTCDVNIVCNGNPITALLTYLLTPWCRVFPEQLTGLQLFKKFPAFHGTQRFITTLTIVRHLSLSWASPT